MDLKKYFQKFLNQIWPYLKPLVALGLIGYLISRVPKNRLSEIFLGIKLEWLFLGVLIGLTGILFSSLKLLLLLRLHSSQIHFSRVVKAYFIGTFFNNFLPTSMGGDVVKINELNSVELPLRDASSATIVERGTGLLAVIVFAFLFACFWPSLFLRLELSPLRLPVIVAGILGLAFSFVIYWFWQKSIKPFLKKKSEDSIYGKVLQIIGSFYEFRNQPDYLGMALGISFLFHILRAFTLVVISLSIGSSLNVWYALGSLPIITFVSLLPISLGALGLREGAIVYALSHLGFTPGEALSVALLQRFITYIHSGVGGVIYLFK